MKKIKHIKLLLVDPLSGPYSLKDLIMAGLKAFIKLDPYSALEKFEPVLKDNAYLD
jgi:hypothetical protein